MKRILISIRILLGFSVIMLSSCEKSDNFSDNIEFSTPMIFRPDSSYYTCTKYVPELDHSVRIKGNAYVNILADGYGIGFYNFTDTLNWKSNEFWAGLNELMLAWYCKLELGRISLGSNNVVFEDCIQGTCLLSKWNQDIPLALFDEDSEKTSWLEITSIDSISNYVEGKFQFHFVFERQDDYTSPAFAKKISYVSGEFRAKANF